MKSLTAFLIITWCADAIASESRDKALANSACYSQAKQKINEQLTPAQRGATTVLPNLARVYPEAMSFESHETGGLRFTFVLRDPYADSIYPNSYLGQKGVVITLDGSSCSVLEMRQVRLPVNRHE